jgi:GT2 family glycosyltransferase
LEPIPCIGIPYCNRFDLLLRCVRSIDAPAREVVIVDQCIEPLTPVQHTELREACASPLRFSTHRNSGCAGAWNEIIRSTPASYWMLVNNDIEFAPGDLAAMHAYVINNPRHVAFLGNHGASWWAVTAVGILSAGLFDENFWPAYLEDCDWFYRCNLLGLSLVDVLGLKSRHGDADQPKSCTSRSNTELGLAIVRCVDQNYGYYERKWGGPNGRERHRNPFNNPKWPPWAWRFDPAWRARLAADAKAAWP